MEQLILQFCLVFGCGTSLEIKTLDAPNVPNVPTVFVPRPRGKYERLLVKVAKNPSREAALTEQESAWNIKARSPYAKGLRQFTDSTGKWMARTKCRHLGSYQPYNPEWSLRCGVIYIESLQKNNKYKGGYCFNRKVAEQEYNGGSGVIRELRRSKGNSLKKAKKYCRRARWACKENYEYPIRISKKQPKYKHLGGTQCN